MPLPYETIARNRYGQAFIDKVHSMSKALGIKPAWLMEVMHSESGLRHDIRNSIGAVGFIQFLPSTAQALGTSPDALASMGGIAQLDYVLKFYLPYASKLRTPQDLYTAAFYPYALGKNNAYVVGSEQGDAWARKVKAQNAPFDLNNNGYVTLGEFRQFVRKKFKHLPDSDFEASLSTPKIALITGVVVMVIAITLYFFRKEIMKAYKAGFVKAKQAVI